MKLSLVYAALAVFMVAVGMFLSNASVEANAGVALSIVILCALATVYYLQERKEPARPLMRKAGGGSVDQRIADLTLQMRNEPDPVRYVSLAERRDTLWDQRVGTGAQGGARH